MVHLQRRSTVRVLAALAALCLLAGCSLFADAPTPEPTAAPRQTPRASATQPASAGKTPTSAAASLPLTLFVEPDDGFKPLGDLLDGAKRSIRMTMYILTEQDAIDALVAAQQRGVTVQVMLEDKPFGLPTINNKARQTLAAAGIAVKDSNPVFTLTHEKAVVVDDQVAAILSLNVSHAAFTGNREYAIITRDPRQVAEVRQVFEADWQRQSFKPTHPDLVWSPDNSRQRLVAVIDGASRTLDIEAEEMQDKGIIERLIAAAGRGVTVRVVISPASGPVDSNAPGLQRISQEGVQVRYLKNPYIHAKMMLADQKLAFIGSENISARSLDFNREAGILVREAPILDRLRSVFQGDWNKAQP
ncbi:MAG: phospholipase [Chloroflexi bacterium]|nr:phospholipase [Chloroflexota bacterium]